MENKEERMFNLLSLCRDEFKKISELQKIRGHLNDTHALSVFLSMTRRARTAQLSIERQIKQMQLHMSGLD